MYFPVLGTEMCRDVHFTKVCLTRRIAVYLGTHCNVGLKRACWPLVSDQKSSRVNNLVHEFAHAQKQNVLSDVDKIL